MLMKGQSSADFVNAMLEEAVEKIDAEFGAEYAKAHPELVGSLLHGYLAAYASTAQARALEAISDAIARGGEDIKGALADLDQAWRDR